MYRTFYKIQLLAVVLFFLSVPLTYSQQDGVIQDERPSIEYTNSLQQSADQPDLISTYDETINHSNGHTLTNGGALTLPFYEGFEASNNIPDGWTQEAVSGGLVWSVANGNPLYATLRAYAGNHNLLFQREIPYTSGLVTRLVTPELDMTGANTAVLKFYYVNPHIYNFFVYQDVLTIKYKAALEDEWTTLETFSTDVTEWTEVSIVLPNLSDSYYVAFEGKCNSGMGITIDEVTINGPQTQSFVITAGAEGNGTITPSGQVIVPAGETQQFDVKAYHGYHINSLLVDGEAVAEAEGEPQFTYSFQSVNAAHIIMANFAPNNSGGTLTLPFYEGFEASNNIPDGWTQEAVSGGLVWSVANGNPLYATLRAYAGNHNLLFQREIPYTSGLVTRLVTPELDMTGANTAVLKFYYVNPHIYNFFVYQDVLTIKYKAALEDEWTTLETFSTDVTEWTEVSIVLPNLSDSYYVAFEGECNSGMGITIDEVSINEPQTQSFVITAGAEGNGTITPSGQVFVPAGETQQFDVKAYHGHQIASLLVDDAAIVAAQGESQFTFTFQSVNAAHTIMAYFTANAQSVTVEVVPHGAGSVSIQGERYYGNTIKLYARSSGSNYVFSHWEADGKTIATENPFKFELLSDTLFEAHFRLVTGIGSRRDLSDHVRVYPNPMKDDLHIDLPIDALVRVFDMQGRLQYEAKLSSGTNTINLSGLNQGTYILKLQFEDQVITKRILHY